MQFDYKNALVVLAALSPLSFGSPISNSELSASNLATRQPKVSLQGTALLPRQEIKDATESVQAGAGNVAATTGRFLFDLLAKTYIIIKDTGFIGNPVPPAPQ